VIHVQTDGPHWFIDNMRMQYMRVPLSEGPREEPYKTMSEGTVLEDFVWHPMAGYTINATEGRLRIKYEQDGEFVTLGAPNPRILSGPTS
jgi:hypothetical protein